MDLKRFFVAVSTIFSAVPAVAADDFIKGVYLETEELCAQARKDGIETVTDAGNTMLSARGLESVEYNCEFVQVIKAERSPAWAVTAICQEPGYLFPDVLSVTQMSPTQIDLVSVKPAPAEGEVGGNAGSYYFCEGVELP
ncbi:hypothetical protein [Mesorhizobium sp. ZC-5]|uniref:hypothetical protein n=1 Tax=Mesorhizobium sp. ZC-5 TaxID=2986066 RepID=UPI0021E762F1|nr:hypothetical protein [Mesorhizobium sp. ZC-5]MCV3240465.1 hypothetical protein [Mesorhizobium sp. ZC-5]